VLPGHDAFSVDKRFACWTAILVALTGSCVLYWVMTASNVMLNHTHDKGTDDVEEQ
jgi:hypothetical protein